MELNTQRIEDAIVAEVADKLIRNDDLWNWAKTAFDARVDKLWREVAEVRIREAIEASITSGFESEYQKLDTYGRAAGAKTTIRAELERQIAGYWNEPVGSDGKPNTYNSVPRAAWLMTKMCADDFSGQMKNHVVSVAGALKDGFRKELNETVNRLLSDVFHVRSLDDQGKGRERIDPIAKPLGQVTP